MAVFKRKLSILQGATFRDTVTWKVGATKESAVPVDLTGYTARAHIRETIDSAETLHELTTENGGIELGGSAGTVALYISAPDTTAFSWTTGVYDLELVAPNGDILRKFAGTVVVTPEVTR